MKTIFKLSNRFLPFIVLIIIVACSNDDVNDEDTTCSPNEALEEILALSGQIQEIPTTFIKNETEKVEDPKSEDYERKDSLNLNTNLQQRWVCTEKEVDILGGTGDSFLYNPNASVIWPGNLLQYNTLDKGTPSEIIVKRAGGTITYDLNVGNSNATVSVDEINLGTVNQAMNTIIEGNEDITPAAFTLDVVAINSKEELAFEMGLNISTFTTKVDASFSFNEKQETSSVLVKLDQSFYTMSYVKPTSLDGFFDSSVTSEQLTKYVQPGNPATFISSVTYGRRFYMLYESTASAEDMKATLEGSYRFVAGSVSGNASLEKLREYNNLTVKVIAYGGDSEGTLNAVGEIFGGDKAVDNLQEIVKNLAIAGDVRSGKPLSYIVNSVEDPSLVVATNLATNYTIKNCEYKGITPPGVYKNLIDLFEDGIGAATQVSLSNVIVFNGAGTKYAWFNAASGDVSEIFEITDSNGPLGTIKLEAVGAGVHFTDNIIYIFDDTGLKAQSIHYNSSQYTSNVIPSSPIGDPTDGDTIFLVDDLFGDTANFSFLGMGFEAACRYYKSWDANTPKIHFFRKPGDQYAQYVPIEPNGEWFNVTDANDWGGTNNQSFFDEIGAAFRIQANNTANVRQIFFNKDGDQFIIWNPKISDGDDFDGPWVIN